MDQGSTGSGVIQWTLCPECHTLSDKCITVNVSTCMHCGMEVSWLLVYIHTDAFVEELAGVQVVVLETGSNDTYDSHTGYNGHNFAYVRDLSEWICDRCFVSAADSRAFEKCEGGE